ncbi:MAG: LicD family protein [Prevotella koreensis]|uniref:LicD family protein n=1 Tax=Prevotella koreensis TaxID=2490854 RepID=UPI003F9F3816
MINMKYITIEEQKKIQIDILSDIATFCETNGIRYFLAYGTLLGAVRHKGYIPWDDDIDIIMPRPDYERFCKEYRDNEKDYYEILNSYTDVSCYINFTKVHDTRTRFQERYSKENNYGVFVDVFPLDGYIDKRQMVKCHRLFRLIHYKSLKWYIGNSFIKNIALTILRTILWPFDIRSLLNKLESESKRKPFEGSEYVYFFSEKTEPIKKELFDEYTYTLFEKQQYRIPKRYDELLTLQYGDYMKLPPEEQRVNKHQAKAWWK